MVEGSRQQAPPLRGRVAQGRPSWALFNGQARGPPLRKAQHFPMKGRMKTLKAKQWRKASKDLGENFARNPACGCGAAFLPVKTLELVGQHDAGSRQPRWQGDFERITFNVARSRDRRAQGCSSHCKPRVTELEQGGVRPVPCLAVGRS